MRQALPPCANKAPSCVFSPYVETAGDDLSAASAELDAIFLAIAEAAH
jgi:hypothetical protein